MSVMYLMSSPFSSLMDSPLFRLPRETAVASVLSGYAVAEVVGELALADAARVSLAAYGRSPWGRLWPARRAA